MPVRRAVAVALPFVLIAALVAALGKPALGIALAGSADRAASALLGSSDADEPETLDGSTPVAAAPLNFRSGPNLQSRVKAVIPAGTELALAGEGKDGFVPVVHDGETGWIYAAYVAPPEAVAVTGVELATAPETLNLRAGPSLDDDVVLVIPAGGVVVVLDETQDGFLPVAYDGVPGFASAEHLIAASGE